MKLTYPVVGIIAALMLLHSADGSAQKAGRKKMRAAKRKAAAAQIAVNPAEVFAKLKPQHPRLVATDQDITAAQQLLSQNPQWLASLKQQGEAVLTQPPVQHKLVGPRLLQESRAALNRITILGFLHRMQPDKRYVDRAVLEMETACAFPDWNPSHFLDTAEMTHAMAIGYDWFYKDLSPEVRARVRTGIVKLGLEEGLKIYAKKPRWINGHNNWNQVCNGGLMIGALAVADEEPQIAAQVFAQGKASLAKGMELFAPDGGWLEASSYWSYTMMYTTRVLSAMHTSLGSAQGLDEVPGFSNTGNFIISMEGPTGKFFNWGDCSEQIGNLPEMFWLARRFDNPVYAWSGNKLMGNAPGVMDILWYAKGKSPAEAGTSLDWYFRGIHAVSLRESWNNPNASFVGFKGGDNITPHSNLDLGTFVFDGDGQRWAVDLGGDDYNLPDYWNKEKRLAYYRIRTEGQNTLVINGKEQGIEAKSEILRLGSHADRGFAIADLSDAYKSEVSEAFRGIMLTGNRRHLVVQDELKSDKPLDIKWTMHTAANVSVDGRVALLKQGTAYAKLTLLQPADAVLSVESAEQPAPQKSNKGISRIVVKTKAPAGDTRIVVQISPGTAPVRTYQYVPLDSW